MPAGRQSARLRWIVWRKTHLRRMAMPAGGSARRVPSLCRTSCRSERHGLEPTGVGEEKMIESWKVPHIGKGMLTYVPLVNTLRARRGSTGGSNSSNYCYAVWLRHLVVLARCGFRIQDAVISELG